MRCDLCRDVLSARLDGEAGPREAAAADAHLATCAECARWWDDAAAVTRLTRLAVLAAPPPGIGGRLTPEVLARAAPGPGRRRVATALRRSLGILGMFQFMLGIAQISVLSTEDHDHEGGVSPIHLFHESAAWNVAIGAGFGWIALRRTRPAALLPLLSTFVVMLLLLSANDLSHGTVDAPRLLSHGFVVAGYVIVLALARPGFDFGDPPVQRRTWPPNPVHRVGPAAKPAPPALRLATRAWSVRGTSGRAA